MSQDAKRIPRPHSPWLTRPRRTAHWVVACSVAAALGAGRNGTLAQSAPRTLAPSDDTASRIDALLDGAVGVRGTPPPAQSEHVAAPRPQEQVAAAPPATRRELSRDTTKAVMTSVQPEVERCARAWISAPTLVTVDFAIAGASGRVGRVEVQGIDGEAALCIAGVVRELGFPVFGKPELEVRYPFRILPAAHHSPMHDAPEQQEQPPDGADQAADEPSANQGVGAQPLARDSSARSEKSTTWVWIAGGSTLLLAGAAATGALLATNAKAAMRSHLSWSRSPALDPDSQWQSWLRSWQAGKRASAYATATTVLVVAAGCSAAFSAYLFIDAATSEPKPAAIHARPLITPRSVAFALDGRF